MIFQSRYMGGAKPTAKVLRDLRARFDREGFSGPHSRLGMTLAPLLNDLVKDGIGFKLQFVVVGGIGTGFIVERTRDIT